MRQIQKAALFAALVVAEMMSSDPEAPPTVPLAMEADSATRGVRRRVVATTLYRDEFLREMEITRGVCTFVPIRPVDDPPIFLWRYRQHFDLYYDPSDPEKFDHSSAAGGSGLGYIGASVDSYGQVWVRADIRLVPSPASAMNQGDLDEFLNENEIIRSRFIDSSRRPDDRAIFNPLGQYTVLPAYVYNQLVRYINSTPELGAAPLYPLDMPSFGLSIGGPRILREPKFLLSQIHLLPSIAIELRNFDDRTPRVTLVLCPEDYVRPTWSPPEEPRYGAIGFNTNTDPSFKPRLGWKVFQKKVVHIDLPNGRVAIGDPSPDL